MAEDGAARDATVEATQREVEEAVKRAELTDEEDD